MPDVNRVSSQRPRDQFGFRWQLRNVLAFLVVGLALARGDVVAQSDSGEAESAESESGILLDVPIPLTSGEASALLARLGELVQSVDAGQRQTVVLRFAGTVSAEGELDGQSAAETEFEDALRVARAVTSPDLRRLRIVSFVAGPLGGHLLLPVMASERAVMAARGSLHSATDEGDETVVLSYRAIAKRRGLFPPAVVAALTDSGSELALVTKTDGGQELLSGDELDKVRSEGSVLSEDVVKVAGQVARLDAEQLRDARIVSDVLPVAGGDSVLDALALRLDLAELRNGGQREAGGVTVAVMLELVGSISSSKSRRWQSNLNATISRDDVDAWLIAIDSDGGDLNESAGLATWFSSPPAPLRTVAGVVQREARGDAALIALACDPLFMLPDATLGGAGADAMDAVDVAAHREFIQAIAQKTNRSAGLIAGLLDRSAEVFAFTNKKTGRIRYTTEADLLVTAEDPGLELERWRRGEMIDLSDGLSAARAAELGLVDGQVSSVLAASRKLGLSEVPKTVDDRAIVRWVERIGERQGLAFFALVIGFMMLSSEASAPGIGVPGFAALCCFAFFFWTQYLAGTAEWLELLAFVLGLACIAVELFVLPGFGVFGIGGLVLTLLGIVLMSQTFVLPRNVYQVEVLTRSIWIALGGLASTIAGFFLVRQFLPHVPILRNLVMEQGDVARIEASERLADFGYLRGQVGATTTPLRPAGKARFGNEIVAVVSDGTSIESGHSVRVIEVKGNRIVVEDANVDH